jgi:hypothetical protein
MKRDILFDELTPLSFKAKTLDPPPVFSVFFVFEVLAAAFCWVLMPGLTSSCEQANLYLWIFVFIIGINLHLFVFGVENFLREEGNFFNVVHYLFLTTAGMWVAYGHYLLGFKGIECWDHDIFWACSLVVAAFDLVVVGIGISCGIFYCAVKKE